ncbi:MAG TPA: hypothetical protein VIQ31_33530 [Phormidium sp.]
MALIFGVLIFWVIFIAGGYIAEEKRVGSKVARRNSLYIPFWLLFGLPLVSMMPFLLLFEASITAWFFSWFFRKQKAGALLVDIGRTSKISSPIILMVWIAFFAALVYKIWLFFHPFEDGVSQYSNLEQDTSIIAYFWNTAISITAIGLNNLELRENGICSMYSLIKWQKISSYAWEPTKPNVLTIRFKQKIPLWPRYMSMVIPEKHKGVVSHILDEQITDKSLTTPTQPIAES